MKKLRVFLAFSLVFFTMTIVAQPITYTWIGGNGSWATSTNWAPTRTTSAATDILQFDDGGSSSCTNHQKVADNKQHKHYI